MISPVHNNDRDIFYQNENVNKLVDLSLKNLDNHIFQDILDLIAYIEVNIIDSKVQLFKNQYGHEELYENIKNLLFLIYDDDKDNLRGSFLELLIFKYLNNKFGSQKGYIADLNCNIKIFNDISIKTVDVFAACFSKGFICECKINHKYFDGDDLRNLNELYHKSHNFLKPFVITLASKHFIEKKLTEIALEDTTNVFVHWNDINVISFEDVNTFFS